MDRSIQSVNEWIALYSRRAPLASRTPVRGPTTSITKRAHPMIMSISTPAAILLGGLIAGTLDIGAAALINGRNPLVILLVIASGLLGKASFQGGLPAAILGLVLQWLMSLLISAIFVL